MRDKLLFNINPDSLLDLRDSEKLTYDSLGVLKEKFEYIVVGDYTTLLY